MRISVFLGMAVVFVMVGAAQAAVYETQVLADDPIAYWRLGETGGSKAINSATTGSGLGSDVDGDYDGVSLNQPGLLAGDANPAAGFDGSAGIVLIPDDDAINTGQSYTARTIELLFNADTVARTSSAPEKMVIYEEGGATRGINLYLYDGKLYFHIWNNAPDDDAASPWGAGDPDANPPNDGVDTPAFIAVDVNPGQTYHAALVYEHADDGETRNGSMQAYLNGASLGTVSNLGRLFAHGDDTGIGGVAGVTLFHDESRNEGTNSDPLSPGDEFYDGVLDEVALYNAALGGQRIMDHYQASIPEPASLALLALGTAALLRRR